MFKSKTKTKQITIILVLCIIISGLLPSQVIASTLKFTDVPDNAYYAEGVYRLVDMGSIVGYGNNKFGPNDNMTRSQYIKVVIASTLGTQPDGKSHILENYMLKAFNLGIVGGDEFPQHTWDEPISREDMAMVLVRSMEIIMSESPTEDTSRYTKMIKDFGTYSDKHKDFIAQAYSKGLLNGYPDGNYGGKQPMIRAQACATVLRLIDKDQRVKPKLPPVQTDSGYESIAPWTNEEFDAILNGAINGTDDTLKYNIYSMRKGIEPYAKVSDGLIYWYVGGSDTENNLDYRLIPESVAPNINKKVYNAVKNLVYNAYINGGAVCLSSMGYGNGGRGDHALSDEMVAHILYRGIPFTQEGKNKANQPPYNITYTGKSADWSLSIPFKPQTIFAMYTNFFDYDNKASMDTKEKVKNFQNSYKDSYKFHWTIGGIYGRDYAERVLHNLSEGEFYNPIDGVHSEHFRRFVNDIYGKANGEPFYKYVAKNMTNRANKLPYDGATHNVPSGTTFNVSVFAHARMYCYTGY